MERNWQEFKRGWTEAAWGWYFGLALLPGMLAIAVLDVLVWGPERNAPGWLFWVLALPATLGSLWWAGLRSGPSNWLGRFVFFVVMLLCALLAIRYLRRKGGREVTAVRRIGRYRVTMPISVATPLAEEGPESALEAPPGWGSVRRFVDTIDVALQSVRRARWSPI